MKLVRATLGDGVDLSSTAPVLGRVGVGLHLELLNFIDRRNSGDGIKVGRSVDGAVEKEIGVLSAGAADRVLVTHATADVADLLKCRITIFGKSDTGAQRGKIEEAAPIQGQVHYTLVINHLPDGT